MDTCVTFQPLKDTGDTDGAVRIFQQFNDQYHDILLKTEHYFEQIMVQVKPEFAQAYMPWLKGVRDLMQGVFMVGKRIPLKNSKAFSDSLRLFSLDSTVDMLHDICTSCKIKLARDFITVFKQNIRLLTEAFQALYHMRQQGLQR